MIEFALGPVRAYLEKNNSKTLLIAFQSAGRLDQKDMPNILSGKISQEEVANKHKLLNWKKINSNFPDDAMDILFITDHLSGSYGWYVMDSGKFVYQSINESLEEFLVDANYSKVISFGSSKGGTAAILFNLINTKINDSISLVPQIKIGQYWRKYYKDSISLITGNSDVRSTLNALDKILDHQLKSAIDERKRFIIYTGTYDDQFNEIFSYFGKISRITKNLDLVINAKPQKHTPLVTENLEIAYSFIRSATANSPLSFVGKSVNPAPNVTFVY